MGLTQRLSARIGLTLTFRHGTMFLEKKLRWIAVVFCWFGLSASQVDFISPYAGKSIMAFMGSSVNFTWTFKGDFKFIRWGFIASKDQSQILTGDILVAIEGSGLVALPGPSSYSVRVNGSWNGQKSPGQVIFTLSSLKMQDERLFGCQINPRSLANTIVIDPVQLLVIDVPQINISSVQASYNEGSSVDISCTASGTPEPDVKWIKNGRVKSSQKKTAFLTFNSVKRTDAGQYTCRANNSAGNDENHVTLVVHYPPTIQEVTTSTNRSWIGQTVTLKCVSDGVPKPTLTWYKPDGNQLNSVTATQNTVNVKMTVDQDFGGYKCDANNGLTPADFKIVKIEQIKKPGSPTIGEPDIQATSLTVKWTAPADDGGSPITAYRVVILKSGTEIKNENVTDPDTTSLSVGRLKKDTEYTVKVFARNAVFEGPAGKRVVKTKREGVPAAATIDNLPSEVKDDTITLKWSEPQNNGKVITQYTVYQRIVIDGKPGEWIKLKTITDISVRELKVELEKGKVYEFLVTATNEIGESLKEDGRIKRITASGKPGGGDDTQTGGGDKDNGMGAAIYAGAAVAGVLLIIGIIVIIVLWRRRKSSSHDETSADELGSGNPYEIEDGYQSVSREAAQSLQASGPAAEPNYAQVDLSKKKKNRRPPTDEYAQVDKSKKTKKTPKKKPGELEYADLDDFRSDFQLAPVPPGAAAAAVVRPPAYEGTEYADIAQFGVPPADPTYANVPKKEVVYSNVESM